MRGLMPTAARMMAIVRARHAASDRSAGPPSGRSVVAPFSMVRCRTKRRSEQRRILIGPTWARRRQSRGSQIELLPLLLHPDLGAFRAFPLPLLVVDLSFDLPHRDLALSTCHVHSSIAPKSASPRGSAGFEQAALLQSAPCARHPLVQLRHYVNRGLRRGAVWLLVDIVVAL